MSIEFGSLADWVSGIGGFLAAGAAFVAWRVNRRMLLVEERRDAQTRRREEEDRLRRRREQAGLVFALGAELPERGPKEKWAIFLFNGSTRPVYEVCVQSRRLSDNQANPSLHLGALPPGRFIVLPDPTYRWGSPIDLSLSPEPLKFVVKGKGMDTIVRMDFQDAAGEKWLLMRGTELIGAD